MTQLGEMVAVGFVGDVKVDCPFHEKKDDCKKDKINKLEGDATLLGQNLAGTSDCSIVIRDTAPYANHRGIQTEADPDAADFDERRVPIATWVNCEYPVAFSAHHLIPAKESLKRAKKLLPYIQKGKRLCCDLGYDVNGNENGVWLPGLHAVNSKGINKWGSAPKSLADKEEQGRKYPKPGKYDPLRGETPGKNPALAFDSSNMKWCYVQAAMKFLSPARQFHDRHPDYSALVEEHLNAVGAKLDAIYDVRYDVDTGCPECKSQRQKGANKTHGPAGLLGLLKRTSRYYEERLKGKGNLSSTEYYTSSWCNAALVPSKVKIVGSGRPRKK